ncbi:MAG: CPBP family intramembrane glutamic endopeptidase [Elainellaceae cyanobacterium]
MKLDYLSRFSNSLDAHALLSVCLFLLVWIGAWLPLAIPLAIALKWRPFTRAESHQKLPLLASLYLIAPVVIMGLNRLLGTSFADYGLMGGRSLFNSVGIGWIVGLLGLILMNGVQLGLGWIQVSDSPTNTDHAPQTNLRNVVAFATTKIVPVAILSLGIGFVEELIFRGFMETQLEMRYAPWLSAAIVSLIFASLHLVWEVNKTRPQLPGLWLMGMVLVLARWMDEGSLGVAWGLHAAWIFGISILDMTQRFSLTQRVPAWITGLKGEPLAGVVGIVFLSLTGLVLWGFC